MSSGNDYIPSQDTDFNGWGKNLMSILNVKAAGWNIPDPEMAAMSDAQIAWNNAYIAGVKTENANRTAEQVKAKNTEREAFEKVIRLFVKRWIAFNPAITDADRTAMGVSLHNGQHTHEHKPHTLPNVVITSLKGAILQFDFKQTTHEDGASHRGKPAHTHGMKIYYKVGDPAPAGKKDCNNSATATRSPYQLAFETGDKGKTVYCYCCWENHLGEEGPLTDLMNTLVVV